ncbi:U1 zinc finger-domain-containing protein [Mycena sp. CBHHK59/15]|nr:U1 zinc finger-domain-containing protein [Mycena sp. CBHHK59/15]
MPKHYCDYCDVFLTHDSTSVRKAHNSGRNHLSNVRDYYASLGHDKAQSIIDQITSAYETGGGPPPGGFGFGPQHLGTLLRDTVRLRWALAGPCPLQDLVDRGHPSLPMAFLR